MRKSVTSLSRGNKRVCHECHTRFFDLRKDPIICPNCGAELVLPATFRQKAAVSKRAEPAVEHDLTDVELVGDDVVDDLIEDASELDDGSDVVASASNGESDSDEDSD